MDRNTTPHQPDHAGLEFIDHGGLEVVDHPDGLEVLPDYPNYHNKSNNTPPIHGYPPGGHGPASSHWDQSVSGNTHFSSSPPSSFAYPPLLANGGGGGDGSGDSNSKEGTTGSSPPRAPREELVCGIGKQLFFVVIAVAGFFIVLAIALGLGLGLGLSHSSGDKPASPATTSSTSTAGPSRTTSYPAPRATVTTGPNLAITCPANNETLYQSGVEQGGGDRRFLLLCDRDYGGSPGDAVELNNTPTYTFADCIDRCAANAACKAAGWGLYQGKLVCWLKSDIMKPHSAAGWYFAVGEEILRNASLRKRSQL
ncbi:hypothetical protein MAPG_08320 [Magnaporthiopsis poae ATCC 64411]|uniref:Apple domain-containing protein n=1 Tax=Magnaporthiopsis poae (strain ATCC 64411 / 73-15) TaxID=644358 RepID=A0A0C4E720_MAGP6|nr:hypothetical protein MAPG_08320 [Magnaporthiopsis poae ATCC 64411]